MGRDSIVLNIQMNNSLSYSSLLVPVIIDRMRTNKKWLISSLALAVFPSLPVIEKDANNPVLL